MKKEILPRGYALDYSGFIWIIAIYIVVFAFFLFLGVAENTKDLNVFMKFVRGLSFMLAILLGVSIFHFHKSYKMRKQRRWCIENALYSVEGIPLQIDEEYIDSRGRRSNKIYSEGVTKYYRIIVTYKNPMTDDFEKAESELYYNNPEQFLKNAEIVVYIRKNPQPLVAVYKK
ncbi:MAG: hypothetical protein K2M73_09005 [Lachnospiraceae bacterium]|nr:hypothetical protein [Lachnospiraceae bacterium]